MNAWKKILKEWILPLGAEVLVIVFLLKVVFMLVLVPSGSMLPTIQKNSILFCTYIHDISQVERGQILVFESDELGKTLIKRLVGLPGETVAIREDGTVTVDGQVLEDNLQACGKDRAWLEKTARAHALAVRDILILLGNDTEDYFLLKKEGSPKEANA